MNFEERRAFELLGGPRLRRGALEGDSRVRAEIRATIDPLGSTSFPGVFVSVNGGPAEVARGRTTRVEWVEDRTSVVARAGGRGATDDNFFDDGFEEEDDGTAACSGLSCDDRLTWGSRSGRSTDAGIFKPDELVVGCGYENGKGKGL